ncbi:hypothetical protein [Pseudomonas sp. LB1P83]
MKSDRAVHQDDRIRRFYDDFVAERSLALLGSCYSNRGITKMSRF